jgi:hypothetical protein
MAIWSLAAAVSWMIVAAIGFTTSVLALLFLLAVQIAGVVALMAAVLPVLLARGIVGRSATVGLFASLYGFGLATYLLVQLGPSVACLASVWLGVASAMATTESFAAS